MKKLIILLLIVGCKKSVEPTLKDCAGEVARNIELGGECYNIDETIYLNLGDNQLTGEKPESICQITIEGMHALYFAGNQLYPPYPECIEVYIGEQDTSNCP